MSILEEPFDPARLEEWLAAKRARDAGFAGVPTEPAPAVGYRPGTAPERGADALLWLLAAALMLLGLGLIIASVAAEAPYSYRVNPAEATFLAIAEAQRDARLVAGIVALTGAALLAGLARVVAAVRGISR